MVNNMRLGALYAALRERIPSEFEANQLFTHVTGFYPHDLPFVGNQPAGEGKASLLRDLCERRLGGEPLQYLLGEWEFYGLPFFVGEGVLIPRADTETLVDAALELLRGVEKPRVLDLCSGSGAVAVAVAHCVPEAEVSAVELSETAFSYLERNVARAGGAVRCICADILAYEPPQPLDLITANPPYIRTGDLPGLQREVSREPETALDGGEDGLFFYRAIARRFPAYLKPGGAMCFEAGYGQAAEISALMRAAGFSDISLRSDLSGVPRAVCGILPK